jgi:hypothetical protein
VWVGFREVDVDPSPKLHDHDVGVPVEASVNCTDCPIAGDAGLYVNDAASGIPIVIVRLVSFDPSLLVTVKVTVLDPPVA